MKNIKGFKVFNPNWTCRGFQYEVGKTFEEDVEPVCCVRGFHFCKDLKDCFNYYDFDPYNKVAEIIALGDIDGNDNKVCTNKIQIVREITWQEVLEMVNLGKSCTGFYNAGNRNTGNRNVGDCNTGNYNAGNYNTGGWNTGDYNTGNRNTGNHNTGFCNAGNRNTGDCNAGNRNTGDCNAGDCNTGNYNAGNYNTGGWNTGFYNTGDYNAGKSCTGFYNAGNRNTGNRNTGNYNTGNYNAGNYNTGDWNTANFSSGCFNTEEQKIMLFNKPSDWTYRDWFESDARHLLNHIDKNIVKWIGKSNMSNEEKTAHPTYKTTGGYLKVLDESECVQLWWDELPQSYKDVIKSIPNFDAAVFELVTGIKIYGKDDTDEAVQTPTGSISEN